MILYQWEDLRHYLSACFFRYGSQTKSVFYIVVIQAPDVATANAGEASFIVDVNAHVHQLAKGGLTITQIPSYADGAMTGQFSASFSGISLSGVAFGYRKGRNRVLIKPPIPSFFSGPGRSRLTEDEWQVDGYALKFSMICQRIVNG